MPTVCACGNLKKQKPEGFIVNDRPCRCKAPGSKPYHRIGRGRVAPVFIENTTADPNRRRLGIPGLTPYEKHVISRDKWDMLRGQRNE